MASTAPSLRQRTDLAGPSRQSLEPQFDDTHRGEDEADELLVDGAWEDEPEAPREPIQFPVRPVPVEFGPLDDLPLFATNGAVPTPASMPASALTNGKVVSLGELAQMVRRRTPRPKVVAEGQLALFAS